jgi:hypothetical protein
METNKKIVIYGTILSLIIAGGLFLYTVYASQMLSYLSSNPKACINCHTMNSAYATWEKSSHSLPEHDLHHLHLYEYYFYKCIKQKQLMGGITRLHLL